MPFQDQATGGRVLTDVGTVVKLTVADGAIVKPGDCIGLAPLEKGKGTAVGVEAGWARAGGGVEPEYFAISDSGGEGNVISATKDLHVEYGPDCDAEVGDLVYCDKEGGHTLTGSGDPIGAMVSRHSAHLSLYHAVVASHNRGTRTTAQRQKAKLDAEETKDSSPSAPKVADTPAAHKTPTPSTPKASSSSKTPAAAKAPATDANHPPAPNPRAESTQTERATNPGAFLAPGPAGVQGGVPHPRT